MGKKRVRVPVANEVRFEIVAYSQLHLRKTVQVITGPGEVADVDVSIDLSLREWDRLRKAIKKARSKRKERTVKRLATIERRATGISPFAS